MIKEEFIRNFAHQIIGIIETKENGDQVAKNFPGRQILGYYRKQEDHTTDFYGRILSHGNTVVSLLYQDKK